MPYMNCFKDMKLCYTVNENKLHSCFCYCPFQKVSFLGGGLLGYQDSLSKVYEWKFIYKGTI